ncbi:MAG: CoA-binding protein [Candidatus Synoicihabitans palmerolidicus]|nr:CoA-binding protein [Candidatus Synoicihabitans palmerolidicus]
MKSTFTLLTEARSIAVVGLSTNATKPSARVAAYLVQAGYTVFPIHPVALERQEYRVYRDLNEIPGPVDIVDVFRPAAEARSGRERPWRSRRRCYDCKKVL